MKRIFPQKLKKGDTIRVIAPSDSHKYHKEPVLKIAYERVTKDLGLTVTFGRHTDEIDEFESSSISSRVEDLHEAFLDPEIKMVIASDGGWIANQLLSHIDWSILERNPKIFCGFSDITVLSNAIFAKTGLISYSGPLYYKFGEKLGFDYTMEYFKKCLFSDEPFFIDSSKEWSDENWMEHQDKRTFVKNEGIFTINPGETEGILLGGNQCTLNLLQGTEFMPDLRGSILFLEDDNEVNIKTFDRDLQSLIHLPAFSGVKGIVVGRFQRKTDMKRHLLELLIKNKQELKRLPVIAGADFGHTSPMITFPVGGTVRINASNKPTIKILEH